MIPSISFKLVTVLSVEEDADSSAPVGWRDVYLMRFGDREVRVPKFVVLEAGTYGTGGKWTWHDNLKAGVTYDEVHVTQSWAKKEGLS